MPPSLFSPLSSFSLCVGVVVFSIMMGKPIEESYKLFLKRFLNINRFVFCWFLYLPFPLLSDPFPLALSSPFYSVRCRWRRRSSSWALLWIGSGISTSLTKRLRFTSKNSLAWTYVPAYERERNHDRVTRSQSIISEKRF